MILGEKERRHMVRNLQLRAKVYLEAKHGLGWQQPDLLGIAGERASQEHLVRKPRTGSLCVSRFCKLERKEHGSYKDCMFHTPFPKRTIYLIALDALLRVIDQKSRIWGVPENLEDVAIMSWVRWRFFPTPCGGMSVMYFGPHLSSSLFLFTNCLKTWQVLVVLFFLFVVILCTVHIHLKRKMKNLSTPVYICKLEPKCFHHKSEKVFFLAINKKSTQYSIRWNKVMIDYD